MTAGYLDANVFAKVDDEQCRSYGLAFGSPGYAECRTRLSVQHRGPEPALGMMIGVPAPAAPLQPTNTTCLGNRSMVNCFTR